MSRTTAHREFEKHPNDEAVYGFIFDAVIPIGDTIASVSAPAIALVSGTSSTPLTVEDEEPNAAAFDDDRGVAVAIGRAVQATVAGGTAGCKYKVTLTVLTDEGETYANAWIVDVG